MAVEETKVDEVFIRLMDEIRQPDKSLGLIEQCSQSVVIFAERMLGFKLYAWQIKFLSEIQKAIDGKVAHREYAAITSRQIGKSTSIAILALWCAVFNKKPGTVFKNTLFGIVSASDEQSKTLLHEIKKLMLLGDGHMSSTYFNEDGSPIFAISDDKGFFTELLSDNDANNTTTITFKRHDPSIHGPYLLAGSKAGSTIRSWPPTSVVLGKTLTMAVIDEAGKIDKITDEFVKEYFLPTGSSTDCIFIYTSTPWSPAGYFYRMVNPDDVYDDKGYKVLFTIDAISIEDPPRREWVQKNFIDPSLKDGNKDEIQRAFYCRFVKGETTFFDPLRVYKVFTDSYSMYDEYKGVCDMGVDFGGKTTSKTVITISELNHEGKIRRLYHKSYPVQEDDSLLEDIAELKKRFNVQRIIPDECPAGDYLIREMKNKGWQVHPMNFRSEKVKKYGAFRAQVNQGNIMSYMDDTLKTEMLALENSQSVRQTLIQHAPGYTDDAIDSFVLSTYFYVQEENTVEFFEWKDEERERDYRLRRL